MVTNFFYFIDLVENNTVVPAQALKTTENMCKDFDTVIDDSRLWTNTDPSFRQCDLDYKRSVRFMSTKGEHLQLKEGCLSSNPIFPIGRCQSDQFTWLDGRHPNMTTESPVVASVCINTARYQVIGNYSQCQCQSRQNVLLQKCSNFYVYKLDPLTRGCNRYCLQHTGNIPAL